MNNILQISSTLSLLEKITQEIILIFHFLQMLYNLKGFFFIKDRNTNQNETRKQFFLSKLKKDSSYWYNLLIYFKELWKFVFWILYLTSSVNIFFNIYVITFNLILKGIPNLHWVDCSKVMFYDVTTFITTLWHRYVNCFVFFYNLSHYWSDSVSD
jgi:hypothetical protein